MCVSAVLELLNYKNYYFQVKFNENHFVQTFFQLKQVTFSTSASQPKRKKGSLRRKLSDSKYSSKIQPNAVQKQSSFDFSIQRRRFYQFWGRSQLASRECIWFMVFVALSSDLSRLKCFTEEVNVGTTLSCVHAGSQLPLFALQLFAEL